MTLKSFTVRGVRMEIDSRSLNQALEAALASGRYEWAEADAVQRLLRPEDTYLELGAGVGFTSTLAWRILGDGERIHAYEANPELIPVIQATWRANGAQGHVHGKMLGKGKGLHEFNVSKAFWASSGHIDYGNGHQIIVEQRDFVKQLDKHGTTFLMMDIEGGEADLLDQPLPDRVRAVVAEYHPRIIGAERVQALWNCLQAQGFTFEDAGTDRQVRACLR